MWKIGTLVRGNLRLYGHAEEAMPAKPAMLQFLNLTSVYLVSTDRKYICLSERKFLTQIFFIFGKLWCQAAAAYAIHDNF